MLTISVDTLIFCHTHFTGIDEDEESLCTLVRQEQIVKIQKKIYFLSILVSSENHLLHVAWSPVADRRQEKDEHTPIWREVTLGVQEKK